MMKAFVYLLVAVFLGVTLAGCGQSEEEQRKEADKKVLKGEFKRSQGKAY